MRAVHGAVCTYRRPAQLSETLDAIASQTRTLDRLLVIDNDDDPSILELVLTHPICSTMLVDVIGAVDNPGPAGAFALAYRELRPEAEEDDIMIIFDDDDPPPSRSTLEKLIDITDEAFADPSVGGVGLRGGQLSTKTGLVTRRPSDPARRTESADHLHGGWFPCYRFSALEAVGDFDPTFFWGFEELELGRRLSSNGFELQVASELYFALAPDRSSRRFSASLPQPSWRHFYRHRNLIRILRRDRAWGALLLTIVVRLVGKPLVSAFYHPRLAAWHLHTNIRAVREGLRRKIPEPKNRHHLPD